MRKEELRSEKSISHKVLLLSYAEKRMRKDFISLPEDTQYKIEFAIELKDFVLDVGFPPS